MVLIFINRKSELHPLPTTNSLHHLRWTGHLNLNLILIFLLVPSFQQAIEAVDCKHICSEYWNCRLNSIMASTAEDILHKMKEEPKEFNNTANASLRGLFKKANLEELYCLQNLLSCNQWSSNQEALACLLNGEIHDRRNKSFGS